MSRIDWPTVIDRAAFHVTQETVLYGVPPTLRRCHYLLVSDELAAAAGYRNRDGDYKQLSSRTTKARDAGTFPRLTDRGRSISRAPGYSTPAEILRESADIYSVNRADLMPVKVIVIAEKDGIVPLIESRFAWLDVSASKGYSSQTHTNALAQLLDPERETVSVYLGDYDPSGLDISRNLAERLPYRLQRVGLSREQVDRHNLVPMSVKSGDSRLAGMVAAEGSAMQVELDALPAPVLFDLLATAITDVSGIVIRDDGQPDWPDVDTSEAEDRTRLLAFAAEFEDGIR